VRTGVLLLAVLLTVAADRIVAVHRVAKRKGGAAAGTAAAWVSGAGPRHTPRLSVPPRGGVPAEAVPALVVLLGTAVGQAWQSR